MAGIAGAYCGRAGIAAYWGVLFAAILFLAVGNLVFLIRRHVQKLVSFTRKNKNLLYALEAAAAVTLLAVGIALRVQGMDGASQSSVYFEAAKVAEGQRMPRLVHGAVYYYIQLLHLLFLLVGNLFRRLCGCRLHCSCWPLCFCSLESGGWQALWRLWLFWAFAPAAPTWWGMRCSCPRQTFFFASWPRQAGW